MIVIHFNEVCFVTDDNRHYDLKSFHDWDSNNQVEFKNYLQEIQDNDVEELIDVISDLRDQVECLEMELEYSRDEVIELESNEV